MSRYLESEAFLNRMLSNFTNGLERLTEGEVSSWHQSDYVRSLKQDMGRNVRPENIKNPHSKIQSMVDSFGRANSDMSRNAILYQIIERFAAEERNRRLKEFRRSEVSRSQNPFFDPQVILNEFFAPLDKFKEAVKRVRELEAKREDLKEQLRKAQETRVPKHLLKEPPSALQQQLGAVKRELDPLRTVCDEARALAQFLPDYKKTKDSASQSTVGQTGGARSEDELLAAYAQEFLNGLRVRLEERKRKKELSSVRKNLKMHK